MVAIFSEQLYRSDTNAPPIMDCSKLDAILATLGWRYDAERERFTDGTRRVDYRRILALIPGMSMDELASYVNEKHEAWLVELGYKTHDR